MAIDWSFWQHIPKVKLWQAAYLACDVDPDKKSYDDILNSNKRNSFTRNHDVEASKLLRRLEANIDSRHFTKSVQGRYKQSWEVRLSEFSVWCLHVGIDIPQELASLAKAAAQAETVANDGGEKQRGTEQTSSKAIQPNKNEFEFSGLLNIPGKVDAWFRAIDDMTRNFQIQSSVIPNETQAWVSLMTAPPPGYEITTGMDKGEDCLLMPGEKPLSKSAFSKRWKKYSAIKSQ